MRWRSDRQTVWLAELEASLWAPLGDSIKVTLWLTFDAIGAIRRARRTLSRTGSAMVRAASRVRSMSMLDESASVCGSYLSNDDDIRLMKMVICQRM